jgi:hypothetical protein
MRGWRRIVMADSRRYFGSLEQGKRLPLEAVNQDLVKTKHIEKTCVCSRL